MGNSLDSYESLEYDKIQFKTGDILLFSGQGGMSGLIKCATFSPWSHVGIVLRFPFQFKGSEDGLYLLHSYNEEFGTDVISGDQKEGVQLNVLKDAIVRYKKEGGRVFIRSAPKSFDEYAHKDDFINWLKGNDPKAYEKSYYQLASSQIDCCCLPCFKNTGDNSSYFCSELVRDVLSKFKIDMLYGEYSDEITPVDLSSSAYGFWCEPKIDLSDIGWKEEAEIEISRSKKRTVKTRRSKPSSTTIYIKLDNKDF